VRGRALWALALLAVLIVGCGGGGEEQTSEQAAVAQGQGEEVADRDGTQLPDLEGDQAQGPGQGPSDPEPSDAPEPSHAPNPAIATERTPGSKAVAPDVPVTQGGDNSIQAFGVEGEDQEATQALSALEEYLQARLAGEWARACASVSAEFREQLQLLIERAKAKEEEAPKPQGCPETLQLLYGQAPRQALQEATQIERVLSFRVREDGYAYLIYADSKGTIRFIAMAEEEGAWKVNTTEAAELPQTEGQGSVQ
jgi:hypothetical protein